jgi:hypothetical protein
METTWEDCAMSISGSRREFLELLGTRGAALGLASLGLGARVERARADHHCGPSAWGDIQGNVGGWTCENHDGFKILEIYLNLGASQWESFWLPGSGNPNFTDYDMGSLALGDLDWNDHDTEFPCQPPDLPTSATESASFASQTGGGGIFWGAATKPIYQRGDIFPRCRMVTQYHDLLPHTPAHQYVLSGLRIGNPRRAGTGAAVQRRARVVTPEQLLPVSYVLHTNNTGQPHLAAVATGAHPGFARPLDIRISSSNLFVDSLSRSGITSESDDLLLSLRHEFYDRMRFRGAGDPIRSSGFEGYWVAAELLRDAPSMQALFANDILVRDDSVTRCPEHPEEAGQATDIRRGIKTMLHAAAELLGNGPARYVCAVDSGIAGFNSYDTHGSRDDLGPHLLNVNANIYNVMHHLADVIHHPTENPSGKINLDDTLIVINTDFNRTPGVNGTMGRDHWPYGYLTIMIGGPMSGGASIRGRIDSGGFTESSYRYSATDMRAALLLAAGIDPFAEGNFRVSDFSAALMSGIGTEEQIRDRLKGDILGV